MIFVKEGCVNIVYIVVYQGCIYYCCVKMLQLFLLVLFSFISFGLTQTCTNGSVRVVGVQYSPNKIFSFSIVSSQMKGLHMEQSISVLMECGEVSVVIIGTIMMPVLSVDSWDTLLMVSNSTFL